MSERVQIVREVRAAGPLPRSAQWVIRSGGKWGCTAGGVLLGIGLLLAVLTVEWSAARHRDDSAAYTMQHARAVLDRAQATQADADGDPSVESHPLLGASGPSTDFEPAQHGPEQVGGE